MVVILALPEKLPGTSNAAEACLAASKDNLTSLNHLVGHHIQAVKHHHVPSFRYMMTDDLTDSMRASPGSKVATLAKLSLSLTSSVRARAEQRLRHHQMETALLLAEEVLKPCLWRRDPLSTQERAAQDAYLEVAVWGQNDCWVVTKCRGKRRLYVVLEQRGNEGLIESCKAADSFASIQFPGLFD